MYERKSIHATSKHPILAARFPAESIAHIFPVDQAIGVGSQHSCEPLVCFLALAVVLQHLLQELPINGVEYLVLVIHVPRLPLSLADEEARAIISGTLADSDPCSR